MPDQVKVFLKTRDALTNRDVLTDQDFLANRVKAAGVSKVEVSLAGDDRRLVFYTLPEDANTSYIGHLEGAVKVYAPIPWFFGKQDAYLDIEIKNGKLSKLQLGRNLPENSSGNLYGAWKSGKAFEVFGKTGLRFDRDIEEDIGKDLDFKSLDGRRAALFPIWKPDTKGRCARSKEWTPVFEQVVTLKAEKLQAYGVREGFGEQTVRLVQIPGPLACGDEGPFLNQQTWYVGILGLPYSWGRTIWNTLLGEQLRVSELDVQHGSLFAPVLSADGNSQLWDLVYETTRTLKHWDKHPLSHSLELRSTGAPSWAQAELPLLRNHLGQPIKASLPLPPATRPDAMLRTQEDFEELVSSLLHRIRNPGLSLRLQKEQALIASSANQSVRIGALDFTFSDTPVVQKKKEKAENEQKKDQDQDLPRLRWNLAPSERSQRSDRPEPGFDNRYDWLDANIDIDWALARISPGGQDDINGEFYADCDPAREVANSQKKEHDLECMRQRERPLVVPLSLENTASGIVLNVQEAARQGDLRRIDLVLRRTDGGGNSGDGLKELEVCFPEKEKDLDRVAVLDREPFLVAKVSFPSLGSLKDAAAGNEIANWQSYGADAGAWHIRFPDAQNFCLTLPPQGVGETMEKRKNDRQGLEEGALADFRLSPPAFLAMRERYYQQNFPEAPWNLRRLLSDPERELPGAHLDHLQYELLYGLSCRVDYPFMRLAEISALVGDVMGPLPQNPAWIPLEDNVAEGDARDHYFKARERWAKLAKRTRQRLGIFELWDIRTLDTLELKENVTCWIRQMPGDQGFEGPKTDDVLSDDPKLPKSLPKGLVKVLKADLANPLPRSSTDPNPGLKGGATWGFESRNVYQAVLHPHGDEWPQSSGAELKDTRFSALGGYGHQMAAFDHWRTKILADVAMGRSYSYTLERVGRIGVWWNRAKHVIVYERTVVPSAQFGDLDHPDDPDSQHQHRGRAVLRKVEEYVEILQNTRRYPDQGKGDAKATGFVNDCSFSEDPNQVIRFRVRGSWGTDIGKIGWKIPIWRPGEKRDDLYPKPLVNLTVMASVDGESVPRKVTIADPENLFFFTDTTVPPEALDNPSIDLSNTDVWLPVEGVDYVDQSRPGATPDKAFQSGSLRQTSAGDTVLPVGFRPCTFLIEPAEHTVDLLANRRGDPMGALLSSVTMCRANFQEVQPGLSKVVDTARSFVAETIQKHLDSLPADARRFKPGDLKAQLENLCKDVGGELEKNLAEPTARLEEGNKRLQQIGETIGKLIEQIDQQATEKITAEAKRLTVYPARVVEELKAEKDKLKAALRREAERAQAQMELAPSPAAYLGSVETVLTDAEHRLDDAKRQLDELTQDVDAWFAAARLPELIQRLRAYRSTLQSISQRIRGFADSAALSNGDDKVALGIGPQWVAKKVDLKKVAEWVGEAEAALASAERVAAGAQEAQALAKARLRKLGDNKLLLEQKLTDVRGFLSTLREKIKAAEESRKNLFKGLVNTALGEIESVIDTLAPEAMVNGLREAWEAKVQSIAGPLKTSLNQAMGTIREETQSFFADIGFQDLIPTKDGVKTAVTAQCDALQKRFDALLVDIETELGIEEKIAEVRSFLERQRDEAVRQIEEELGGGIKAARQILGVVESMKDDVLKLVRAFGKPPEVSGLQFDRPEVAFFYDELKDRVNVTPVIARAAQAAAIVEALKPFGVDLPVKELGEQLIPAELRNFNLSSILPNIAGIPLQDLFSGLKMPEGSSDAVKVRHGLDKQTRRAWVNTEVNFQAKENATLFAVGPLAVMVNQPRFRADARMEADLQGIQQRKVSGELRGDWLLQIGGFPLITFKQTPLTFDEAGRIDFKVNPQDVQLAPALDFINDLMTTISPGGLSTRFDGDGVVSTLDLPIPDTQLGAFGFSGLRLCASLALRFGGGDFNIGVTAGLARRDAPFTLTVFILGGAGYLELGSRYHPSTGKVAATADMAIAVSASLAIALGPIRGGVAVYLGVTANYDSERGGGLVVGLMFMIRGHVSVLSIASATITLRLDGQYQNGAMVGRGSLEIKIKICWCFTLEVSESVTYTLGSTSGGSQRSWLEGPQPVAQLASLHGMPSVMAATQPDEVRKKLLKMAVEDYLDMLV